MKKVLIFATLLVVGMCSCKANSQNVIKENKVEITSASPLSEEAHGIVEENNKAVERTNFSPSNEILN